MAFYNNRSFALDRSFKRAPRRPLGPVGHRLAGVLRGPENPEGGVAPPFADKHEAVAEQSQRFAVVRRGYDRTAVDEYVSRLEGELAALDRELAELRGGGAAAREVATEIQRIGEQTSAVLMAAHEQREDILRRAQAEADRVLADATAKANTVTAESEQRLRELGTQTEAAQSERDRLLDQLRTISAGLAAVADSASAAT